MSNMMKAAVLRGPRSVTVEQVPIPEIGPRDVLLKVRNCGICGSDMHSYKTGMYVDVGQIMGHEFMGTVAGIGDEVSDISLGDRVTAFSAGVCGVCDACRRGQPILCAALFQNSTGYGRAGAFAEYVKIENAVLGGSVHRLPGTMNDLTGAMVEPVSVGIGAVEQAQVAPGDRVVVLGAGMIGNACLQAAKAAGAAQVIVVEVSPVRLAKAIESGADAVFDARTGDALRWVMDQFGAGPYHYGMGGMADVVFEAAGSPITIRQSFEMVRPGGTICIVGLPEQATPIDTTKIVHKMPRIVGSLGGDFGRSIAELTASHIKADHLVTHRFCLDQAAAAFEMQSNSDDTVKVMIQMG